MQQYNITPAAPLRRPWLVAAALHAILLVGLVVLTPPPATPVAAGRQIEMRFTTADALPSAPAAPPPLLASPVPPAESHEPPATPVPPADPVAPPEPAPAVVPDAPQAAAVPEPPPGKSVHLTPPAPRISSTPRPSSPRAAAPPLQARSAPMPSPAATTPSAQPTPMPAPASEDAGGAWRRALATWLQTHRTYPDAAQRDGVEGRVVVHFTIDADGLVGNVTLARSSGFPALDDAALALLRGAKLPPPPPPAPVAVTLPIRYSLTP